MARQAHIRRKTAETDIDLALDLDGSGAAQIGTAVGFFDHMLTLLAKHAAIDLTVRAQGDLHVDQHHTVEDVGICFGQALRQALGDKSGIRRYGHFTLPMDEALVTSAVDLGGRYYLVFRADFTAPKIGDFDTELINDFWQAVAANALANLHVVLH
jgi:imidazoleglycerol-phosphate dehydratase